MAHEPDFQMLSPEGLGHVVEVGTPVPLRWRVPDADNETLELFTTREAVNPYRRPDSSVALRLTPVPLSLAKAPQEFTWDTTGLAPGCYQPYAAVREPAGTWYFVLPGKVTVRSATSVPPAVWFTNAPGEEVDAWGRFVLRYRVHDPDSATTVTLQYGDGTSLFPIAAGLTHPVGGGEGTAVFDASALENSYYELHARVEAEGEPPCEAFWTDVLYVPGGPYRTDPGGGTPVPDAGVPGEPPDAGPPDPPSPPPPPPPEEPPPRSGCAAAGGGGLVLCLAELAAWTRRRRSTRRRSG